MQYPLKDIFKEMPGCGAKVGNKLRGPEEGREGAECDWRGRICGDIRHINARHVTFW